ncbi:hypothetical protein [Piscinibacter sp.]|jgi:hypothetical protein|uniref:hypothetical protein n=1 Tax=Piscinibacter sp. TaxID=1903157 RepID=UPI002F3E9271
MSSNVILFGFDRPTPGREMLSAQHFQTFTEYLGGLQRKGTIQSFEPVFLDPHGGDLNGFILIRGESQKLDTLIDGDEWRTHVIRAMLHLDKPGVVRGAAGDLIAQRMAIWTKEIPK